VILRLNTPVGLVTSTRLGAEIIERMRKHHNHAIVSIMASIRPPLSE
jgi:hypothetical protein